MGFSAVGFIVVVGNLIFRISACLNLNHVSDHPILLDLLGEVSSSSTYFCFETTERFKEILFISSSIFPKIGKSGGGRSTVYGTGIDTDLTSAY